MPGPFSASTSRIAASAALSSRESSSQIPSPYSDNVSKPQLNFPDGVDNTIARGPYVPSLPYKHHAMVPLGYVNVLDYTIDPDPYKAHAQLNHEKRLASHPYYYETRHIQYPTWLFASAKPIEPAPIDQTEAEWVDTPEALESMVEELKAAKEIAVDLEHHDSHSYYGFTCLMQISTRDKDWLIDTLALRGALREHKLGGVFADPSILKVFHGADHDITWLQKDFDLFVVNLFDTYHATKALNMTAHSLSNLLHIYCGFTADKRYQMADWRVRPLTPAMRHYAQSDTHFLLYIFDNLRNALLDKSRAPSPSHDLQQASADSTLAPAPEQAQRQTLGPAPSPQTNPQRMMRQVLEASSETSLRMYEREMYDTIGLGPGGWQRSAKKFLKNTKKDGTLVSFLWQRLHAWRDALARQIDEAPYTVLTNDNLRTMCLHPPSNAIAISNILRARSKIASKYAEEILEVIQQAQKEFTRPRSSSPHRVSGPASTSTATFDRSIAPSASTTSTSQTTQSTLPGVVLHTPEYTIFEPPADLWRGISPYDAVEGSATAVGTGGRASTSALFGKSGPKTAAQAAPKVQAQDTKRKATSSLFGSTSKGKAEAVDVTAYKGKSNAKASFDEVQSAIFSELAPKPSPVPAASPEPFKSKNVLPEPETVPFIPREKRETADTSIPVASSSTQSAQSKAPESGPAKADVVPDASDVVEVKASKKKKRKLAAAAADSSTFTPAPESAGASASTSQTQSTVADTDADADGEGSKSAKMAKKAKKAKKIAMEDIPTFDYSSTTNLLDNPSSASGGKKKKAKKPKTDQAPVVTGSTFGKLPQDQSQPKAGNRSQTFF